MCRPQRPEGEEVAEEAPPETENQGPPNHVAASSRQPARHVRGQERQLGGSQCGVTERRQFWRKTRSHKPSKLSAARRLDAATFADSPVILCLSLSIYTIRSGQQYIFNWL